MSLKHLRIALLAAALLAGGVGTVLAQQTPPAGGAQTTQTQDEWDWGWLGLIGLLGLAGLMRRRHETHEHGPGTVRTSTTR